ncbi:MAG: hypothetical protein F4Y38_14965 [Gemmatimonadetes bacterium]|nr:hypothetical protein [Gemmatimonadota bacterium]MYG83834.1 hypothetical protein [Gemmatimonadota bacterium]MYJ90665.1 hypothetical protein [Gemmatimonadota bacterium]
MRDLNSGQAHPAARVVYENAVSGRHPAAYHEPQVRRQKGYGQRGGLLGAQMFGLSDDQAGLHGYVSGHGTRHHPQDHVADFHGVRPIAARDHFADAFPPEGRWPP